MGQDILGFINAKTVKGEKLGWITGIRYLAPAHAARENAENRGRIEAES